MTDFNKALKRLPGCLHDGLDLMGQHKTVDDLLFAAQTELDLHDEGEIALSRRDRMAVLRFIRVYSLEHIALFSL